MLARQAEREGRPQLPLVDRVSRTALAAADRRDSTRPSTARSTGCASPALDRDRLPAVERGRPQPALARRRRGASACAGAATSPDAARFAAAIGHRVALTNGVVKIGVPAAAAGRPTTEVEFRYGLRRPDHVARSRPGTRPPRSARPRCSAAAVRAGTRSPRPSPRAASTSACTTPPTSSPGAAFGLVSRALRAWTHRCARGHDGRRPRRSPRDPDAFAVSFDYRCPFARNGHEAVVHGLARGTRLGRPLPRVLARPGARRGGRAAGVGPTARRAGQRRARARVGHRRPRRRSPTTSSTAHVALFAARHDKGAEDRRGGGAARGDRDVGRARRRRGRGRGRDAAGR